MSDDIKKRLRDMAARDGWQDIDSHAHGRPPIETLMAAVRMGADERVSLNEAATAALARALFERDAILAAIAPFVPPETVTSPSAIAEAIATLKRRATQSSEADRDVGAQAQTRARLKARIAGNVASGPLMRVDIVRGPGDSITWVGMTAEEAAGRACEISEAILQRCGL